MTNSGRRNNRSLRVGFVSTRLAGTDGVSLETRKWVHALEELGHTCFFFAGECDYPHERSMVVAQAHFDHPEVRRLSADLFDDYRRSPRTSDTIRDIWGELKHRLNEFLAGFDIQLLVVENALSIPMNVPLGMALTELIAETGVAVIAHHHDFSWERARFAVNAAEDYLQAAFPPAMPTINHVVINSFAAHQLALRTGMRSMLIPNVMDFDNPPPGRDGYAEDLRRRLGLSGEELFVLQPTRIVPRKRIERAVEIVRYLERPAALVISHSAGDEGLEYREYLIEFARTLGVRLVLGEGIFEYERGAGPDGAKRYSLADAYRHADLVTYPSAVEGFGNAFLEAIYFKKPLVMCTYDIFRADISPKGFEVIGFDDFITRRKVAQLGRLLDDPEQIERMVRTNYRLGMRYYSYSVLRKRLSLLLDQVFQETY
jgi:glycosyltransferase involved in cell wall biosynthesis